MLSVGFEVVKKVGTDDEGKKRLIFENYILEHDNPKVEEITRSKLDKFLKAVGVDAGLEGIGNDYSKLEDYTELPFIANVKIQAGTNGYSDSNKITAYKRR